MLKCASFPVWTASPGNILQHINQDSWCPLSEITQCLSLTVSFKQYRTEWMTTSKWKCRDGTLNLISIALCDEKIVSNDVYKYTWHFIHGAGTFKHTGRVFHLVYLYQNYMRKLTFLKMLTKSSIVFSKPLASQPKIIFSSCSIQHILDCKHSVTYIKIKDKYQIYIWKKQHQ